VWDGRPLDGRHVLVRCYHGLGDTIQFARFLPMLGRRAASLTIELPPALIGLIARLTRHTARLVAFRPEAPSPPAECDIEIMELAHAFRTTVASLPLTVPYLAPPPERVAELRRRLGAGGAAIVGMCNEAGAWNPDRSVPLAMLQAAARLPDLRRIDLRRPDSAEVLETAAVIGAVDLVITVDTMVAHLAGAMGRPTWLLLKADADWRWMASGRHSPWYPSMRLYRQTQAGDWRRPLAELGADLREWMAERHLRPAGRRLGRACS
jgi:hypothetical protein